MYLLVYSASHIYDDAASIDSFASAIRPLIATDSCNTKKTHTEKLIFLYKKKYLFLVHILIILILLLHIPNNPNHSVLLYQLCIAC